MARRIGLEAGGSRSRHPRRRLALLASGLLLASGCQGEHLVLTSGESGPAYPSDGEAVPMEAPTAGDLYGPPLSFLGACPPGPAERRQISECWPSRYVGAWSGFFTGDPKYEARDGSLESFPTGELALRLEPSGAGSLSFGDAELRAAPAAADDPYLCAGATPSEGCPAARRLVEGFVYTLENLAIYDTTQAPPRVAGEQPISVGERFAFEVSLGEPWRSWCAAQLSEAGPCECTGECGPALCYRPRLSSAAAEETACEAAAESAVCGWLAARAETPCSCSNEGCSARERPLELMLRMSEDGDSVRGEYLPARRDLPVGRIELWRVE